MKIRLVGVAVVALFVSTFAFSAGAPAQHPPASRSAVRVLDSTGDHPLTTVSSFTGQVDAAVVAVPGGGSADPSGTLNLTGLPAGATIQSAWLVGIDYSASASASATFGGQSLGSAAPTYVDPGYPLEVWRFSVTSLVTGNASYSFSVTGMAQAYGVALVVVYSHASLPTRTVVVNMGGEDLANASSTTSFAGLPVAGAGRLIVFTGADDAENGSESLAFNGTVIPGVVFDQNLGPVTSLISQAVTVQAGANTATVTTGGDQFGWAIAVLAGPAGAVPNAAVPALSAAGLVLFGLAIAALAIPLILRRSIG